MADPPLDPDSNADTSRGPGSGPTTSTPRWVKVFGIIGIIVVLLLVGLLLLGGGSDHGPNRHAGISGQIAIT